MDAVVSIPGAEPWSARGHGERAGTAVVLTHGITGSPRATRPLGQRLAAEGYHVEVPLLPGHGTSVRDMARTRYADWIGALERVVDHVRGGCDRVVLIGHSMGGSMSLDVAARRHDEIDAVGVINVQVSDRTELLARLAPVLQHVVPYVPRELAGLPVDDIARPGVEEGAYRYIPAKAAQSFVSQLPRIRDQLSRIDQPILIAWSPRDHTVPSSNSVDLRAAVASEDVTEVVCDRSYHLPMLDYDATKLEDALVAWLARVTGTAAEPAAAPAADELAAEG